MGCGLGVTDFGAMGLKLQALSLALRGIRSLGTRLGGSGVKEFRISGSRFVGLLRSVRFGFGIWVVSRLWGFEA